MAPMRTVMLVLLLLTLVFAFAGIGFQAAKIVTGNELYDSFGGIFMCLVVVNVLLLVMCIGGKKSRN